MITINEKKILMFLLINFNKDYSINEISRNCNLAPNGAYEILRKFEEKEILSAKKIANLKSYKINFDSKEANKLLELILIPDYKESRINYRHSDLKPLERIAKLCIIFGYYITKKEKPNDIDILFAIRKSDYKSYNQVLEKVRKIIPFKIHDVIQTKEDLIKNIKRGDKTIIKIMSEGVILLGHDFLIGVIKNVTKK